MKLIKVFFLIVFILCCELTSAQQRFKIENGSFLIVGKRTQLICGEMHYSCIPHEYWRDRLKRTKAMGLNTISTYVLGNFHKRQPDIFDFKGQADLSHFIKLTQEESLYVLLRPGLYVCAEWDFGGYPYRLLNEEGMVFRSRNEHFLKHVKGILCDWEKNYLHKLLTEGTTSSWYNWRMNMVLMAMIRYI